MGVIMAISKINGIPLNKKVTPVGLIKGRESRTLENVELRATLDKAVEDAGLNVTEILALNERFFPNGGGFDLFTKSKELPTYTLYLNKGDKITDKFTKEALDVAQKTPGGAMAIDSFPLKPGKTCFQENLDSALKKLYKVLKGNI